MSEKKRWLADRVKETAVGPAKETTAKPNNDLLQQIKDLEKRLALVEKAIPRQKTIVLREITREEAKSEIEDLFKKGDILYYSDISEQLRIDLELVVEICEELIKEGKVKIADSPR